MGRSRMKNLKRDRRSDETGRKLEKRKKRTSRQKPILISPNLNPRVKSNLIRSRKR